MFAYPDIASGYFHHLLLGFCDVMKVLSGELTKGDSEITELHDR